MQQGSFARHIHSVWIYFVLVRQPGSKVNVESLARVHALHICACEVGKHTGRPAFILTVTRVTMIQVAKHCTVYCTICAAKAQFEFFSLEPAYGTKRFTKQYTFKNIAN